MMLKREVYWHAIDSIELHPQQRSLTRCLSFWTEGQPMNHGRHEFLAAEDKRQVVEVFSKYIKMANNRGVLQMIVWHSLQEAT